MKFIDFFSGVGGFTRGLELVGHECIGHCEYDKFAEASYRSMHTITEEQRTRLSELDKKKRQKEILKDEYLDGEWYASDVRTVNSANIPRADCWTFGAQAHRVYDSNGIACTQNAQAGGVGAKTGLYAFGIDKSSNKPQELQVANCLTTKDRGVSNRRNKDTAIAIPVLTPFRKEKRQNGRRCKEAGEDMFTLTTQDQHGIAIKADEEKDVWAVWSEKYNCYLTIRKLTPRESFRLQGWTDNYYERAEFVNSNSQLYKQAGNGVTVNVVKAIGEKI